MAYNPNGGDLVWWNIVFRNGKRQRQKKKKFKNKKLVLHILEVNGIVTNSNKLWGVLTSL